MGGIIFLGTSQPGIIRDFYTKELKMQVWLDQGTCLILRYKNMLLGFCEKQVADIAGTITIFCHTAKEVDIYYKKFSSISISRPKENHKYNIYNFFAKDPEGRTLEFQAFLHEIDPFIDGQSLLIERRSIREFSDRPINNNVILNILESCRYSPTSRNTQGHYYLIIKNRKKIEYLASLRGASSAPIKMAPIAVAVCSDPSLTKRPVDDAIIAAYHFMLSAWMWSLGTCYIASMNTEEAKECLGVPKDHYIATITPLGQPSGHCQKPDKKHIECFYRTIT